MKIICDNCDAKYSIADERAKGRVFKIRCKKCSHIIVVRGITDDDACAATAQTIVAGSSADAPIWHVVIDGEQVGPMTAADVNERFRCGEINCESFTWREGFSDWIHLSAVETFRDLVAAEPEANTEANTVQMTGQRRENSVLFSLDNLQQLAAGAKPVAPTISSPSGAASAGSGLVDIRAMAAKASCPTRPASNAGDLPELGGFATPFVAAPVLIPATSQAKPKWLWPVLGGGGVLMLSLVGVLVFLLVGSPVTAAVASAAATNTTAGPDKKAREAAVATLASKEAEAAKKAKAPDTTKAPEKAKPTAVAEKRSKAKRSKAKRSKAKRSKHMRSKHMRSKHMRRERGLSATGESTLATKPPPSGKPKGELDILIDEAINNGVKRKKTRPAPTATPTSRLPAALERSQIQRGMRPARMRVRGCYDKFKVPGLASVQVTIGRDGRVSSARIKGIFSGTPTGTCVANAVRSATFPRFSGSPLTITYPFMLR